MLEENKRPKMFWWIITAFLLVPLIVSIVSTIHVINFFELSNYKTLALTLAIAFEIGALSALAGLVALDKINKNVVYFIFIVLTLYQMMGNTYFAYDYMSIKMLNNPDLIKNWKELFGLTDMEDIVLVKRIIAIVSGAILPIVSLSFLDLSINYIQKSTGVQLHRPLGKNKEVTPNEETNTNNPEFKQYNSTTINPDVKRENIDVSEERKNLEDNPLNLITEDENIMEESDEDFQKFIENKKQKLEELRGPMLELLRIFYKGGEIVTGQELPSYSEFLALLNYSTKFTQKDIKRFLTLCNYLEIFRLTGTQKIALKSYAEAINSLQNYLSWN